MMLALNFESINIVVNFRHSVNYLSFLVLTTNIFTTQLAIGAIHRIIKYQLCEIVFLFNFRRLTSMLDLGECLSLHANNLPSAVYLSPVQTPTPSKDGNFMFVGIGVR